MCQVLFLQDSNKRLLRSVFLLPAWQYQGRTAKMAAWVKAHNITKTPNPAPTRLRSLHGGAGRSGPLRPAPARSGSLRPAPARSAVERAEWPAPAGKR